MAPAFVVHGDSPGGAAVHTGPAIVGGGGGGSTGEPLSARPGDGRRERTPVYQWFTEGFDAADLQDAGELLDALKEA